MADLCRQTKEVYCASLKYYLPRRRPSSQMSTKKIQDESFLFERVDFNYILCE